VTDKFNTATIAEIQAAVDTGFEYALNLVGMGSPAYAPLKDLYSTCHIATKELAERIAKEQHRAETCEAALAVPPPPPVPGAPAP
jgi:ribosomal protein L6P/L9E